MRNLDLSGKVALVTGASRGIGREIARALSRQGAFVWANYSSSEQDAVILKEEIEKEGGKCEIIRFNVAKKDEVDEAISQITSSSDGPVNILINNAGITKDTLFMRMKEEAILDVLQVNLIGAMNCAQAALSPMIKARWGRIINISSVVASMGNAGQANYCASKAGIEGFTRALAREVAARGVTCNAIAPGFIDTDMTSKLSQKIRSSIISNIPMGRMGEAKEVASACVFLASNEASYITGHVLHINGGLLCN